MCHNVVTWVWEVSTLNKYQSTPNYITLPHFGGLERLRTAHVVAMTLEVILCQSFCESISNLVFGVDREDLDESLAHMSAKIVIGGPAPRLALFMRETYFFEALKTQKKQTDGEQREALLLTTQYLPSSMVTIF
jgi:hypothetical protein